MKQLTEIKDPGYTEPGSFTHYERFFLSLINDKRDIVFIYLLTFIHLTILPLSLLLFTPFLKGIAWWLVFAVQFFLAHIRYRGPFGLMQHCLAHRKFFKKKYNFLNHYFTWFVVLFFGHTPESYKSHHLGMHHIENNLEEDGSSTLPYQRDSFTEFLKYYFRFLLRGVADLFIYLLARKKKKYYMPLSIGEITYFIACTGLCFVNLRATLCVFIIPLLVTRLVMMLGNWTQHAFNDPSNPSNLYTNNINCINTKYNTKCWNDGYHLIHHLKPGIHYTEHPIVFKKELPKIAAEKSFVFDGIHYLHLFYYLMTKRYDKMAFHLVNINNAFSSDEEAMHLLKERTQKIAISS